MTRRSMNLYNAKETSVREINTANEMAKRDTLDVHIKYLIRHALSMYGTQWAWFMRRMVVHDFIKSCPTFPFWIAFMIPYHWCFDLSFALKKLSSLLSIKIHFSIDSPDFTFAQIKRGTNNELIWSNQIHSESKKNLFKILRMCDDHLRPCKINALKIQFI